MFWFIAIVVIIIVVAANNDKIKNKKETAAKTPSAPPPPLNRIRYVQVDFIQYPERERISLEYEGTVRWSAYHDGWVIFIDSSTFVNKYLQKVKYTFFDAGRNLIPMDGYNFADYVLHEGDCGELVIRK